MSHTDTPSGTTNDTTPEPAGHALLGLLEVLDRHGAAVARLPIHHWPVTVGRALSADLVLDDAHVAAQHLRIDTAPNGGTSVTVLDTLNGVRHGAVLQSRDTSFDWDGTDDLVLGRLRLRLRLPGTPLAPELALPDAPWGGTPLTVALMLAVVGLSVLQAWFKAGDTTKFAQTAVTLVGLVLLVLNVWAGVWALATKLFTGHLQFWRHMRIACAFSLIEPLVSGSGYLLAFSFSWESLAQFNFLLSAPLLAAGLFAQLLVIAPQRKRGLVTLTITLTVLGLAATMGNTWLQSKRATTQLYMGTLLPPSWRIAPTVPVEQFMLEAQGLGAKLDQRLQDNDDAGPDDAQDAADADAAQD
jgi:hypothetical protein